MNTAEPTHTTSSALCRHCLALAVIPGKEGEEQLEESVDVVVVVVVDDDDADDEEERRDLPAPPALVQTSNLAISSMIALILPLFSI